LLLPKPGVTKENFDRIKVGMTYKEVSAIFGEEGAEWEFLGKDRRAGTERE
jgi:hypothetical protein